MLGGLAVLALLVATGLPAHASVEDCGGGDVVLLQDDLEPATVVGARIRGIGAACDGQPVGVQFLGNDAGDPAQPADELAHAYSDEDPCTGEEQRDGVLRDGTVAVLLCEGSPTSGFVDGRQLTSLRLITTAGVVTVDPGDPDPTAPDPADPAPPAAPGDPDPAPEPPADGDLPLTGADVLRAVVLGALLVLAGSGMLRLGRARMR